MLFRSAIEFYSQLVVLEGEDGESRIRALGLTLLDTGEQIEINGNPSPKILIDNVEIDSPAAKAGLNWDQTVLDVALPQNSLASGPSGRPSGRRRP